MTVTLAQPRRIFSVEGDTLTDLVPTSAPTLGNTLIALVYAHSIDGNNVSFSQSTAPWTTVDTRYSGSAYVTVYVASLATQALLADSALTVTATNTDLLAVHLYEIEAPPDGFAFNFLSSRGNVSWHDSDNSEGTSASISFTGFPLLSGDIEMATLMMAGFSNPLSNTTTEPTIDSGFGGNIGPATEGVFASEFDSVMIESGMKTWEFDWTTSTDGIVMGIGLMVDRSGFARVQRKSSLTSSLTLDSTPVEGNLLFATVAVSDGEVPPNKAGWNRIVGAASTEGDRLCVFWREVVAGQGEEISFTVINGYGISVEEWDGFYGSPTVSGAATGGFIRDPSTGFGGYVAIIPALPLIDRIVVTSLLFTATPQEFMVIGDEGSRSFVGGQRVFSGADSTAVVSSYSPGFVGAYATNTETVLDADGLIIVFSDSSVVAPEITDPVPGDGPFVFPEEGSRLAYTSPPRRGGALTSAKGIEGYVYLDAEGTTLAVITDLDGEVISGSLVTVDSDSKLPLFQGPGTVKTLYIRWAGTTVTHPVYARGQSAPVDYGTPGFAKVAETNTFTERQEFWADIPVVGFDDADVEFSVIGSFGDADGGVPLIQFIAAHISVEGQEIYLFGTAVAEIGADGDPTGRYTVSAGSTGVGGGEPFWSHVVADDLKISRFFTGEGISILPLRASDPAIGWGGEEANSTYAATQGWVTSKLEGSLNLSGGFLDASAYGVVADGVTDDTEALEAVMAAAEATGADVLLPKGTILERRKIKSSGVLVKGRGAGRTTITRPATYATTITQKVFPSDTTVHVEDASGFTIGDSFHLYDTASWEGGPAEVLVTDINTDNPADHTVSFSPPAWSEFEIGGTACNLFSLAGNYTPDDLTGWMGTDGGGVTDLTLDQNVSADDPKNSEGGGQIQTDFVRSALHIESARNFRTERVKFVNACGDAYSDQGRADAVGINSNKIEDCRIDSPYRHGIHLGTTCDGAKVFGNVVTGIGLEEAANASNGFAMFFCAAVTNSNIEGNYFTNSKIGISGIDYRDSWNTISNNFFINCPAAIVTVGGTSEPFGMIVEGNIFWNDDAAPATVNNYLGLPDILFTGNRLHNASVRVTGDRTKIEDNIFTLDSDNAPQGVSVSLQIEGASSVTCNDNSFDGSISAVEVVGASGLRAHGNKMTNTILRDWTFSYYDSPDADIRGDFAVSYISDGPLVGSASKLLHDGMGDNGTDDPSLAGDWSTITGTKWNGTTVRWLDGSTTKISLFIHGVGWILLGNS